MHRRCADGGMKGRAIDEKKYTSQDRQERKGRQEEKRETIDRLVRLSAAWTASAAQFGELNRVNLDGRSLHLRHAVARSSNAPPSLLQHTATRQRPESFAIPRRNS